MAVSIIENFVSIRKDQGNPLEVYNLIVPKTEIEA